jgi:hypothetical protein
MLQTWNLNSWEAMDHLVLVVFKFILESYSRELIKYIKCSKDSWIRGSVVWCAGSKFFSLYLSSPHLQNKMEKPDMQCVLLP